MDHNSETLALVRQAGIGNQECMEKLLELTRPRLFGYLMRLTMDYHLAEDILQDVQTEIVTSLWRLNQTNRFWPWIYKNAWGKVKHHYRDTRKHDTLFLSNVEKDFIDAQHHTLQEKDASFCHDTQTEQLFETIYDAMKTVGLQPRNVLTMRCFEDMSFQEIGEFLECSETNTHFDLNHEGHEDGWLEKKYRICSVENILVGVVIPASEPESSAKKAWMPDQVRHDKSKTDSNPELFYRAYRIPFIILNHSLTSQHLYPSPKKRRSADRRSAHHRI